MTDARGAVIEIIERRASPDDGSVGASVTVPNEVRINGQAVMIPEGFPVKVHDLTDQQCVLVTLTVVARSVTIGVEDPGQAAEHQAKLREFLQHLAANQGAAPSAA